MSSQTPDQDFVEVHDEPRHRFRYQNEVAYIYDVLIPPGDITLYHRHKEDTLYVSIGDAHVCDHRLGKEPREGHVERGTTMLMGHREKPLIHQVTNRGTENMRLIGAEVLASPPVVADTPLQGEGLSLRMEEPRLRAYRLDLGPGQSTPMLECRFSGILIMLTAGVLQIEREGAAAQVLSLEPAAFLWQDGPLRQRFSNPGGDPLSAILGEWR